MFRKHLILDSTFSRSCPSMALNSSSVRPAKLGGGIGGGTVKGGGKNGNGGNIKGGRMVLLLIDALPEPDAASTAAPVVGGGR